MDHLNKILDLNFLFEKKIIERKDFNKDSESSSKQSQQIVDTY